VHPAEINNKLSDLLINNAKVWTPANLLIYNAPLEFRAVLANLGDIFWQSIVADMHPTTTTPTTFSLFLC
jgi:hypothetical protein